MVLFLPPGRGSNRLLIFLQPFVNFSQRQVSRKDKSSGGSGEFQQKKLSETEFTLICLLGLNFSPSYFYPRGEGSNRLLIFLQPFVNFSQRQVSRMDKSYGGSGEFQQKKLSETEFTLFCLLGLNFSPSYFYPRGGGSKVSSKTYFQALS